MGKKCKITSEICKNAHCTSYDGISDRNLTLKKGQNIWEFLHKDLPNAIWCDSCKDSFDMKSSAIHDITSLSIGEREKPYSPQKLKDFMELASCTYEKCRARGDCV